MTHKVTKPIALDESFRTTEQNPQNIADVLANKLDAIKSAIENGGSGEMEAAFECHYNVTSATDIYNAMQDKKVPFFYQNGVVAQLWKVETNKYTFRTTSTRVVEGENILDIVDYIVNGSVWSTATKTISGGSSSQQAYLAKVESSVNFDTTGLSGMQSIISVNDVPTDGVYQLSIFMCITPKTASATKSDLVFQFTGTSGTGMPNTTFHAVVDDSQTFGQQLSFSTTLNLKAGTNSLKMACDGLNTEYLVFVDNLTVAQLVNGVYHNGDNFDEVHTLTEAADFNNDDGVLVDGATGGPRFMLWTTLANKVLGFIKSLSTTITAFRTGDHIAVDGPEGPAKMPKDNLLKETAENARNGMVIEKVYEHNGVSASSYVVSNTTSIRGVCAPFKANTFDKIKLKVQCTNATTLAVSIMDTSFNVLKSKSVSVEGTSEPYDVMIDWGEVITMNSSFYLDVQVPFNTDNTFLNASGINYEVCDNYAYHAYIYIKVSTNRFDSQFKSVNCEFLLSTDDVRIPNLVEADPQRIQNLAPVMNPPIIYTAVQDLNNVRNYGVNVYPDHCFNTETMPNVKNDGLDHKFIRSGFGKNPHTGASYVQANNYDEENLSIDFVGENKKVTISTKHISLKASVQNGKKAFVLVIGDSQGMYGGGKLGYANGDGTAFWMYAAKLFDMDKADGATSDVVFLGSEKFRSWSNVAKNEMTYEYLGNERTIHAASESIGSWSINHFLHKATEYTFVGSTDVNEVYTGSNPINPFYDYARVNEFDIFSIDKWLERFRTLDDDGNRLTWGDPRIGTLISESSLQFINVCKPTHVICMLGRNTVVGPNAYGAVCEEFITAVKRDCPSAKIAMCLQPDMPGTFNGSNYPEVLAPSEATTIYKLNERANQFAIMRAIYNQCKERENDNVFIVPVWFSQPTMYGWNLSAITDFTMENKEKYVIQGDDFHPSGEAQKAWAYQLYCWILHTMYIDSLNE